MSDYNRCALSIKWDFWPPRFNKKYFSFIHNDIIDFWNYRMYCIFNIPKMVLMFLDISKAIVYNTVIPRTLTI